MHSLLPYLKAFAIGAGSAACAVALVAAPGAVASDHNDGPRVIDPAMHAGDITDVYTIREIDQSKNPADKDRVLLVMTTDGLVAPGMKHAFDPAISYEFHIKRGAPGVTPKSDQVVDFRFSPPTEGGAQTIWMNGKDVGTTSIDDQELVNRWDDTMGAMKVFAGPRDDPFFLDLQVIRCGIPCAGGAPTASDSFGKSNVSAIVASLPLKFLQGGGNQTTFGVWGVTRK